MLVKVDENLHDDVAALLTSAGHDAQTVHNEGLRGCDDVTLSKHCAAEGRAIVTLDLNFADIREFPPVAGAGSIVLRVRDQSRQHILPVVARTIDLLAKEPWRRTIMDRFEAGARIRGG